MMKNEDMPAMPAFNGSETSVYNGVSYTKNFFDGTGLTKREMFAMHAMQGLLTCVMDTDCTIPELCIDAVAAADALLDELERTK